MRSRAAFQGLQGQLPRVCMAYADVVPAGWARALGAFQSGVGSVCTRMGMV